MEIWLIKDGEKSGPFHDYEIRRRIGTGDLEASSPAWHEGLPAWTTLSEISLFRDEFIKKPEPVEPTPQPGPPPLPPIPPVVLGKPRILRRFWARWFDIYLYVGIWWFLMWLTGRNIEALFTNPMVAMTRLVPWFVIETLLIHRFGRTPGKWLLGLKVTNLDGSHLTLGQSTRRALRVYFIGIGFAIPYVLLFCMALSAFTTKRIGAPVWDHVGKHRVDPKPFVAWKVVTLVCAFFGALQLQFGVISPVVMKLMAKDLNTEQGKPLKEMLEKNPPWSLPRRDQ
ncbi:RDD family protein [Luteolibacter sp. SL250]|uniref:RDD family protein n=1 Tax=Luteolibacter sp. SL250 TaxID=2995170 RepID=UPI00227204CE|nr:RDD family protein [Luteolibacter sp. SL250]WAC20804.1 RDD family protein [Luteolibacter sp. SL250]